MAPEGRRRPRSTRLRVYIVEDSRTQAEIARGILEQAGHEVSVSLSSVEALREIPAQHPDCVLLDIMMPELDGHELCRRLRALPELSETKLVMVSAKAYHYERRRALEMAPTASSRSRSIQLSSRPISAVSSPTRSRWSSGARAERCPSHAAIRSGTEATPRA